jgi:thymidine kinase
MELTLILGPMKSGKSFELISYFAPLKYTDISYALFQSARNERDNNIASRNGANIEARKISSLHEALNEDLKIVGIDELHMFAPEDVAAIDALLKKGVKVIASGLDTDYRGKMFDVIRNLLELGPKEVRYKRAVCEVCKKPSAVYSQVLNQGEPITEGMPSVLPDDGTYTYMAVCRDCFVKK